MTRPPQPTSTTLLTFDDALERRRLARTRQADAQLDARLLQSGQPRQQVGRLEQADLGRRSTGKCPFLMAK